MYQPRRFVILGAAGRDFHNFNVVFRDDPAAEVVAFTAAQIPGIAGRTYPAPLAGPRYPRGIPILDEADLETIVAKYEADTVVFAYSDVRHDEVMHRASRALAAGADFVLLGPDRTMLQAAVPVIAVSAVRTGAGKSQVSRWLGRRLRAAGQRVAVIRHPMPYGDLERQRVQRFAVPADLEAADCTVEEREEYEPHIAAGNVVHAGVDYAAIAEQAAREADVIVWDGGNNDFPFLRPNLHLCVVDALRPGHATAYHPGEAVLRMADVVIVNKVDAVSPAQLEAVESEVRAANPGATVVRAASPVRLDDPTAVAGRRVVVVEDGPTITHGGMPHGAGFAAATEANPAAVLDPRAFATPAIRAVYDRYPHIGPVLPAMGYSARQLGELRTTLDAAPADIVVSGTPIDLASLVRLRLPVIRARYEFAEAGEPTLASVVDGFLGRLSAT
ncbi:MAG: cyclic 2,3-diphosphoglycerate synthase [Dehalococcoidia bacterium]